MNPIIASFIPGFAKASMAMRMLGITNDEVAASDRLVASVRKAPFLRFLPADMMPGDTAQAVQLVASLSGITSGVPNWLLATLEMPQVRQVVGHEVEKFILASPDKDHLLSAIGKIARQLMGDVDLDTFPTLSAFVADGFLPAITSKLEESRGSSAQTTLHKCRKCGEAQVIHDRVSFACRFCSAHYNL